MPSDTVERNAIELVVSELENAKAESVNGDLPPSIQRIIQELLGKIKNALAKCDAARVAHEAVDAFDCAVSCRYCDIYGRVELNVTLDRVKDVSPVLAYLARAGYRQSKEPETNVGNRSREWYCGEGWCGTICVHGFFGKDSACKFVKTGTTTVERDVFEIHCDGELANVD